MGNRRVVPNLQIMRISLIKWVLVLLICRPCMGTSPSPVWVGPLAGLPTFVAYFS